jgi:hypothetical protein
LVGEEEEQPRAHSELYTQTLSHTGLTLSGISFFSTPPARSSYDILEKKERAVGAVWLVALRAALPLMTILQGARECSDYYNYNLIIVY